MVNNMAIKSIKHIGSMLMATSLYSHADAGRICFETDSPLLGGLSVLADFRVSFNKGEVASIVGQQCNFVTAQHQDCLPSEGSLTAHEGRIEIAVSGANVFPASAGGEVFVESEMYTNMDPDSGIGKGKIVMTSTYNGESSTQNFEREVRVIPCPKLTPQDKENIKTKDLFIKRATKLK